jgi:hypothetical protein
VGSIVAINVFDKNMWQGRSAAVRNVLKFYQMERKDIPVASEKDKKQRIKIFEASCPDKISPECRRLLSLAE